MSQLFSKQSFALLFFTFFATQHLLSMDAAARRDGDMDAVPGFYLGLCNFFNPEYADLRDELLPMLVRVEERFSDKIRLTTDHALDMARLSLEEPAMHGDAVKAVCMGMLNGISDIPLFHKRHYIIQLRSMIELAPEEEREDLKRMLAEQVRLDERRPRR